MGLTKWIFTNGKGSIGETSRVWSSIFQSNIISVRIEEAFFETYLQYTMASKAAGANLYYSEFNNIERGSMNCLAIFIFRIICENIESRQAFRMKQKTFEIALEVIYEQVKATAPKYVKLSFPQFKTNCLKYINL